ncbi:FG-GAP-like repeat-containing protein [Litoreibacter janthinus]|uniref:FG-GAP repeat-containing protein n=1 Tax=Litoreibacter janthinus TaxID=670154 RepID=A0A1I6H9W8_9RHOB|nr:FG-GAP-like repeat-containing protein [Litoreibacter janthinus]SFR51140.1 FG-GAP repeat-containing protein [Litoreibacter janthinus]
MIVQPDWAFTGQASTDELGIEVATAGDVNGDGYDDVVVGAYQEGAAGAPGGAYVFFGSADGLSETPDWHYQHDMPLANFGRSVRSAGDLNGDGFDDIVVGAPTFSNRPSDMVPGSAYVFFGGVNGPSATPDWSVTSPQFGDRFARAVGGVGDTDGDGFDDLLVGGYFHDIMFENEGGIILYSGGVDGPSNHHDWVGLGGGVGAGLGWAAGAGGDINGDGYADVIAGAPKFDAGEGPEGRLFVYYGGENGLNTTPDWTWDMGDRGADLGRSFASAGDINGDGFDDVIAGARLADDPSGIAKSGAAMVFFGSADGLLEEPALVLRGEHTLSFFGNYVTGLGDINGDGFDDFAVGAPGASSFSGRIYVYLGAADGLSEDPALILESPDQGSAFGFSVWSAGDIDGDGLGDMIVGAPFTDVGDLESAGAAYVYTGATLSAMIASPSDLEWQVVAGNVLDDVLVGGDTNDLLIGHGGQDSLTGGAGNDRFVIMPNSPLTVIEDFMTGEDVLDLSYLGIRRAELGYRMSAEGELILLVGQGDEVLLRGVTSGSQFNDETDIMFYEGELESGLDIVGTPGDDLLEGLHTSDNLVGGAGDDVLTGGGGADHFIFAPGSGHDVITDFVSRVDKVDLTGYATDASALSVGFTAEGFVQLTMPDGSQIVLQGHDSSTGFSGDDILF